MICTRFMRYDVFADIWWMMMTYVNRVKNFFVTISPLPLPPPPLLPCDTSLSSSENRFLFSLCRVVSTPRKCFLVAQCLFETAIVPVQCSLSIRQCQQIAIARMHSTNCGLTNICVEFWVKKTGDFWYHNHREIPDLWPLKHLNTVMRKHDIINKKTKRKSFEAFDQRW